jgi:hypothetical protein
MGATLLVNHPRWSWREWLRQNLGDQALIVADPGFSDYGWAGRVSLVREKKIRRWRFVGVNDAVHAPLPVLTAVAQALPEAGPDPLILAPSGMNGPIARELVLMMGELAQVERVMVPEKSAYARWKWPWPMELVAMENPTAEYLLTAHRRAMWVEMLDAGHEHEIDLADTVVEHARMGGGQKLDLSQWGGVGWTHGAVLHVITDEPIDEFSAARLMDEAHARRISLMSPIEYHGILCSQARADGRDVGMGVVRSIDPKAQKVRVLTTTEEGAKANILRLGLLRLDDTGNELGDLRSWTV